MATRTRNLRGGYGPTSTQNKEQASMRTLMRVTIAVAFGLLSILVSAPIRPASAQGRTGKDFVPPIVFQAAGPTAASIQGAVAEFRAALGDPNNGNNAGPLSGGRREI